jgi:beta-N-acetylhexosaminidase
MMQTRLPVPVAPGSSALLFNRLPESERVAQFFMIGTPAASLNQPTLERVQRGEAGAVILTGRSLGGSSRTRSISQRLQSAARSSGLSAPGLFIAADQEGGQVQVLRGEGFDRIPAALEQGRTPLRTLTMEAARWGRQLAGAGVNLDLGPVLDTVADSANPENNPPIGSYDRQFGFDPETVFTHGNAVIAGLEASGVSSAVKHFPGLGRVTGNTDFSADVIDTQTTRTDPFLVPFKDAVRGRVPFVMISTAIYQRIDAANPAAFSAAVVTGLLRHDLGFTGVVISDDLGNSAQVRSYSPGERAVGFLRAGGDMVLTVDASLVSAMRAAVIAKMADDPAFAVQVDAAVQRVLRAKLEAGLG